MNAKEKFKYYLAKGLKIVLNPPALNHCEIDKTARVCGKSELDYCRLGRYSYVGYQCRIINADIGQFCSIGQNFSGGGGGAPYGICLFQPGVP